MDFDPEEFVEMARAILASVVGVYSVNNKPLPLRQYLSVGGQGETVHDCEQVTVSFEQGYSGTPGDQAQLPAKCNSPRTGVFIVEIVRCIPTTNTTQDVAGRYGTANLNPQVPDPESLTAVSEVQMVDAYMLMQAGLQVAENTIAGALVDVSAGSASGGFQAMIMTVTMSAMGVEYYG